MTPGRDKQSSTGAWRRHEPKVRCLIDVLKINAWSGLKSNDSWSQD
jgi:acyl-CoA-binding protein